MNRRGLWQSSSKPSAKHAILAEVTNFAALNEPDNAKTNEANEHIKPTYSEKLTSEQEKRGEKSSGAELRDQYWRP